MLVHPHDPSRTLLEVADLDHLDDFHDLDRLNELATGLPVVADPSHRAALREVATWLREYLCRPHADLGRPGAVCPYAPGALDRGLVYLRVEAGDPPASELDATLLGLRDWFLELAAADERQRTYLAIVTVLPDLPADRVGVVIEGTQRRLKSAFVEHATMIGEFHPGPPERSGLWNPDFRPFACPQPVLAIRHMVAADFPFIEGDDEQVRRFLRRFGTDVPAHLQARVEARARELQ